MAKAGQAAETPAMVTVIQCHAGNVTTANAWELAGAQGAEGWELDEAK